LAKLVFKRSAFFEIDFRDLILKLVGSLGAVGEWVMIFLKILGRREDFWVRVWVWSF
jgi:hypothetical protein